MMFESLDFLYVPAPSIRESIKYYTKVLDGELLWKIHAYLLADVWFFFSFSELILRIHNLLT
jgi:hypothetical protein